MMLVAMHPHSLMADADKAISIPNQSALTFLFNF